MTILTTIPNGASNKDIRDTLNNALARILALEGTLSGGTPTPTPTPSPTPSPTPAPTPTPSPTPTPTTSPVILSSSAINDVALDSGDNNGSRWVDAGTMSLPDADWTIHVAVTIPANALNNGSMPILSMGGDGNNVTNAAGVLNITYFPPSSGMAQDPFRGVITASGYSDDFGRLQRDGRASVLYFDNAATPWAVPLLAGPRDGRPGDDRKRSIFLCRRAGVIELWVVDQGCAPLLHDRYDGAEFKGIAAKRVLLGAFNRTDKPFGTIAWKLRLQRFFKVNAALTTQQMAAVAQGVDPRVLVTFNSATDRLVAFTGTTASQTDLVSGQTVNLIGSGWAVAEAIIPSTVTAEMPRARVYGYGQVMQRTGRATSDLSLDGTVTGQDGDIYARVVDWSDPATVVADWQKVATSSSGAWAGKMTGVPSNQRRWLDVQLRKGASGTVYALRRQIGLGVLLDMQGQSIAEFMASSGTRSAEAAAAGFVSYHSDAHTIGQRSRVLGWNRNDAGGWGASVIAQKLGEQLTVPIGIMCGAVEGSTAASWAGRTSPAVTATPAFANDALYRPGYIWWQQGQGSTGDGDAVHTADLDKIEADRRAALPNGYRLIFTPLINAQNSDLSFTRFIQERWLRSRMASDTRIVDAAALVDLELRDTIHQTDNVLGAGRIAERVADKIAFLEGGRAGDPLGPRVASIQRVSNTVTRVTVQHRGSGATLKTNADGMVTGFEISVEQAFGSTLAISGAAIVNATTVELTHASTGGAMPWVWYQRGRPGQDNSTTNGLMTAVSNALYDDATPSVNSFNGRGTGYPLYFMTAPMQAA